MFNCLHKSRSGSVKISTACTLAAMICLGVMKAHSQQTNDGSNAYVFKPELWALEYGVSDVKAAIAFYTGALGFEVESNTCCSPATVLRNGAFRLLLSRSEAPLPAAGAAQVYLNMRVGNIAKAAETSRAAGGMVDDFAPQVFALGKFLEIRDPSGNIIHLLDVDGDDMNAESKPRPFNLGVTVENLESAEAFYTSLGFKIFSKDFLPQSLPLQKHGAIALVLHPGAAALAQAHTRQGVLILATDNLKAATIELQGRGVKFESEHQNSSSNVRSKVLRDPSGNLLKLMELVSEALPETRMLNHSSSHTRSVESARAGFERFKKLVGEWRGRSTKGWEEAVSFKTIAQGSVVVETSFDAHPNETMMTMFHLDGERLVLTHYCVAGNQPRLEATAFEDGGRTITFTFREATNLATRDRGHMDKAVFRFIDDDHFSSQWTWYQDGRESWMEEIKLERKE